MKKSSDFHLSIVGSGGYYVDAVFPNTTSTIPVLELGSLSIPRVLPDGRKLVHRNVDYNRMVVEDSLEDCVNDAKIVITYSIYPFASKEFDPYKENVKPETCTSEIPSVKIPETSIWGSGDAGSVERMGGVEEVLNSIISLAENQAQPLTLPLYVETATGGWFTLDLNIKPCSGKPSPSSETSVTPPVEETGSFLGRTLKNWQESH